MLSTQQPYAIGLRSQPNEIRLDSLPIRGQIPNWLRGTLVRNGPGQFEAGARRMRHWFDGSAQLHKFGFQDGQVNYANKFLETKQYRGIRETGKMAYGEFASDPCRNLFGRVMSLFHNEPTDNTNVNITLLAGKMVAITELPMAIEFDPETLATLRHITYDDVINGATSTPHPHFDYTHAQGINETTRYGRTGTYQVYRTGANDTTRHLIGTVETAAPAYMHSFAITENYVVLVEFSARANALKLLMGSSFADALAFDPNAPSRFHVMRKADGEIVQTLDAEPFFAFHHVNAYEDADTLVVDIAAFPDAQIVRALFMDEMLETTPPLGSLRRYRVPLTGGTRAEYETISSTGIELPRINYERHNGRPYRYAYGIGADTSQPGAFMNQLVKIDTTQGTAHTWAEKACHPGEPVFVARPDAKTEDDGVLLSAVLDRDAGNSFLLVLDAATLTEIGRATVPQVIPLGFHGLYMAQG